jgi:hypothetical protein
MAPIATFFPSGLPPGFALVASYRDLHSVRKGGFKHIAYIEHGIGQSYAGDPRLAKHPAYAGGRDHGDVELFLVPNQHAGDRWMQANPNAHVLVHGSPRVEYLRSWFMESPEQRELAERFGPVVGVSFHWSSNMVPELKSALPYFGGDVQALTRKYHVLGHCHPKARTMMMPWFKQAGIEFVPSFENVLGRADVYVCDNSSTIYEFASLRRPVVLLNPPWYRRTINHGLRFWDAAGVGVQVNDRGSLLAGVTSAFDLGYTRSAGDILAQVYQEPMFLSSSALAAKAIAEWIERHS